MGRNGDKTLDFSYFFFFVMRFSGVTFTLVTPFKPVYTIDEDEDDTTEAVSL